MYAAWAMFGYSERTKYYKTYLGENVVMANAERAKSLVLPLYHQALIEAPDHPYFPVYAIYFGEPNWVQLYQNTLSRFLDHPYAPMMSWYLATQSTLPADEKANYMRLYEENVGRLLEASEEFRLGYQRLPELIVSPALNTDVKETEEGLLVFASPYVQIELREIDTLNSDRVRVGLFLHVLDGQVWGQLIGAGNKHIGDPIKMGREDFRSYRLFSSENIDETSTAKVILTAGEQGARFLIRDFYPMIENPRFFR
jgi:hypothetical protein